MTFFVVMLAQAQRICVIADLETKIPIKDVLIHTNTNHWARTKYTGQFAMPYAFDSASVSKPGYIPTEIYLKNLPDTVFLLPQSRQIGEVEVWGKDSKHIDDLEKQAKKNISEYAPKPAGAQLSFDFANILDAQGRRDAHHQQQAQKVISDYETAGDPIVNAYEKTMQELGKDSKTKRK
jgi:hypothetical protein